MPIQLDRILDDIANEQVLHPNHTAASKKEIEEAWSRVGKNNNLSVHESRSIFKVLQKKYEQEKTKENSSWKLFAIMDKLHKKVEIKTEIKEEDTTMPVDDDEEYEMLEVHEEEDTLNQQQNTGYGSGRESPSKSFNNNANAVDKDDKVALKTLLRTTTTTTNLSTQSDNAQSSTKLLNSMASFAPRATLPGATKNTPAIHATSTSFQKKGITLRKAQTSSNFQSQGQMHSRSAPCSSTSKSIIGSRILEVGKTIQLPESLKRKLSEDPGLTCVTKKCSQSQQQPHTFSTTSINNVTVSPSETSLIGTSMPLVQIKQDRSDTIVSTNIAQSLHQECNNNIAAAPGINLITITANPTSTPGLVNGLITTAGGPSSSSAAPIPSTSTNGFSPRLEDIDFRGDIIFDANHSNGTALTGKVTGNPSEIINLGNFENSLPPTFFKNLCNSSRHEALGLYVANVMNRLKARSASKLELAILRSIIEIQNEELEQ